VCKLFTSVSFTNHSFSISEFLAVLRCVCSSVAMATRWLFPDHPFCVLWPAMWQWGHVHEGTRPTVWNYNFSVASARASARAHPDHFSSQRLLSGFSVYASVFDGRSTRMRIVLFTVTDLRRSFSSSFWSADV